MKKDSLIIVFIMFISIGLLIFFLPEIYNKVQNFEASKEKLPDIKLKEDEEKIETITMDSEIVNNLVYPIMRNDKNKLESYFQLESITSSNFSNNDILYNAFLDVYDGYLVDHVGVGCTNNSKEFDATYLSSRIKNIIGRDINYKFEDFSFYEDMSIDYLLSFDTNEKTEGLGAIEIDKENGVDQLDYIISRFNEIVK